MDNYLLREIQPQDNAGVEALIRSCLIEFHANCEGTAWTDPNLGCFSKIYHNQKDKYWVAEQDGVIVAGVGVGALVGYPSVCELQKMYCLPQARGSGISHRLMETALSHAALYYEQIYLETMENMVAAQRFYEKYGFQRLAKPLGHTDHFACDVCYLRNL